MIQGGPSTDQVIARRAGEHPVILECPIVVGK